jgi:hypothetical protein
VRYEPREHIVRELAGWLFAQTNTDGDAIAEALASFPDWASWSIAYHPFMQRLGVERLRATTDERRAQLDALEALLVGEQVRRIDTRRP